MGGWDGDGGCLHVATAAHNQSAYAPGSPLLRCTALPLRMHMHRCRPGRTFGAAVVSHVRQAAQRPQQDAVSVAAHVPGGERVAQLVNEHCAQQDGPVLQVRWAATRDGRAGQQQATAGVGTACNTSLSLPRTADETTAARPPMSKRTMSAAQPKAAQEEKASARRATTNSSGRAAERGGWGTSLRGAGVAWSGNKQAAAGCPPHKRGNTLTASNPRAPRKAHVCSPHSL